MILKSGQDREERNIVKRKFLFLFCCHCRYCIREQCMCCCFCYYCRYCIRPRSLYFPFQGDRAVQFFLLLFSLLFLFCCHCRYCIRSRSLYIPWQGDSSAAGVTKYKIFRSLLSSTLLTIILSLLSFFSFHNLIIPSHLFFFS